MILDLNNLSNQNKSKRNSQINFKNKLESMKKPSKLKNNPMKKLIMSTENPLQRNNK